jgi:NAD(P)-dependent dehydrogenase (short-subunit alcohol dehydrogenase family)
MTQKRQVVVVTGASAGVGRAVVREFAARGAALGLIARGPDALEATRVEVCDAGTEAIVCAADVSDWQAVDAAAGAIEARFGPIDVWINNAMVSVFSPVAEMQPEEYRRVTEVTYLGYVHGTLAALHRMTPRDRGVIVQVGSALAYRGIPLQSAYCAAKHAIQGFTESLRAELLHDRSHVRLVEVDLPGLNTPQFGWTKSRLPRRARPVPPVYQPEAAARWIYKAAQGGGKTLFVGFPTWQAVVGNRVLPDVVDIYLGKTGYDSQQLPEPAEPLRRDNLWQPVPGDHGARGSFDAEAKPEVAAMPGRLVSMAAPALAAGAGVVLGAVLTAARRRQAA